MTHLMPESGPYDAQYVLDRRVRLKALSSPMNRSVCQHVDASICEVFPEWMIDAGPGLIRHARVKQKLEDNPLLSLQMLLSAYDETHPLLERTVLRDGEAVVPLLEAIDAASIKPASGRKTYEKVLLNAPWWGLRYLSTPSPSGAITAERSRFTVELKKQCEDRRLNNPQSALVFLLLHAGEDPAPYATVLCEEPMVAYLASRLLGPRGLNLYIENVVNMDPRWATHIALWGAFAGGNVSDAVEEAIVRHAAWAGEYIARNDLQKNNWPWISGIYGRMEAACKTMGAKNPDLWADFLWALLDRLALQMDGKEPRITIPQSFERQRLPPAKDSASSPPPAQT